MNKKKSFLLIIVATLMVSLLGIVPTVNAQESNDGVVVYRIYNPNSGEHLFTTKVGDKNTLYALGWTYEGIAWIAPASGDPVYRLYNPNSGEHLYTKSIDDKRVLLNLGWKDEGIGWYTESTESECSAPVYRLYNPYADAAHEAGSHIFTLSESDKNLLMNWGWEYEGVAFFSSHNVEYHEGTYAEAFEYRGTQIFCNECHEMIFDGWDRGTDFDSIEELMARHLNDVHDANIDINYVDPARWKPFEEKDTFEEYLVSLAEYMKYLQPRLEASLLMQSRFTVDYEGSEYEFRPKQHIIIPGYALCQVCDHMFYEK